MLELREFKAQKFIPNIHIAYCNRVIDGDTIEILTFCSHQQELYKFSVRIANVNCPELRSRNPDEKRRAQEAKKFVEQHLLGTKVELKNVAYDKFGRILADVGKENWDLGSALLMQGHAIPYMTRKKSKQKNKSSLKASSFRRE